MTAETERDREGDESVVTPSTYSNWGIVLRAVVLAAIITAAAYFATVGFLGLAYPPP